MLRALVVLPVYLACSYFAPQSPLYQRFHAAVLSSQGHIQLHLIGYAAGLVLATILALAMQSVKPRTYAQTVLHAVFRMGLIGVAFACAWQLYQHYTGGELSVLVLLAPAMFMAAELIYEFAEFVFAQVARLFGAKQQSA